MTLLFKNNIYIYIYIYIFNSMTFETIVKYIKQVRGHFLTKVGVKKCGFIFKQKS